MPPVESWQVAEVPGPKKASLIMKPDIVDAMIKRAKHPVLVIGHLAAEIDLDDHKMIDFLIMLAEKGGYSGDRNRPHQPGTPQPGI